MSEQYSEDSNHIENERSDKSQVPRNQSPENHQSRMEDDDDVTKAAPMSLKSAEEEVRSQGLKASGSERKDSEVVSILGQQGARASNGRFTASNDDLSQSPEAEGASIHSPDAGNDFPSEVMSLNPQLPSMMQDQVSSASSSQCRLEGLKILENDVVMNKKSGAIGVVSNDKLHVFQIDENKLEEFREDELLLLARNFVHSKRVSSVTEREKIGVIIGVETLVDLASSTGDIIHRGIGTVGLERMRSLDVGDTVINGSWVGIVDDLELSIVVRFENRIVGTYSIPDPKDDFIPIYTNAVEKAIEKPYYRGQAFWYSGDLAMKKGNVIKQNVKSVTVRWIGTSVPGTEEPPHVLRARQVRRLTHSVFGQENWEVGMRCNLRGEDFLIVNLHRMVRVKWQEGVVEQVDSREVVDEACKGATFFSGFLVSKQLQLMNIGFVKRVINGDALVEWLNDDQPNQLEHVNVDELTRGLDYRFDFGGIVYRKNAIFPVFGMVIDLDDGRIQVGWEDNTISIVGPEEVARFSHDLVDEDDPEEVHYEDDEDDSSYDGFDQEDNVGFDQEDNVGFDDIDDSSSDDVGSDGGGEVVDDPKLL